MLSFSSLLSGRLSATSQIRRQRRRLTGSLQVLQSDRHWFLRHPRALVRFRPERRGDFALLALQGREPPAFLPDGLDPAAPLNWVAVVDVLRAIDLPLPPGQGALRARIRTVPIRSRRLQAQMGEVFAIAVCRDVLAELESRLPVHAKPA